MYPLIFVPIITSKSVAPFYEEVFKNMLIVTQFIQISEQCLILYSSIIGRIDDAVFLQYEYLGCLITIKSLVTEDTK